jgi:hypothetical protein
MLVVGALNAPDPELAIEVNLLGMAAAVRVSALLQHATVLFRGEGYLDADQRVEFMREQLHRQFGDDRADHVFEVATELDRWIAVSTPSEWVPRARNHLLNSLPRSGVVDFLVRNQDSNLAKPNEQDDFLLSHFISISEDDFRRRSLSAFSLAVRLGAELFGDAYEKMNDAGRARLESLYAERIDQAVRTGHGSVSRDDVLRSTASALAGQHWYFAYFVPRFVYYRGPEMSRMAAQGLTVGDLAAMSLQVMPPTARMTAANLLEAQRRGDTVDLQVDADLLESLVEITGIDYVPHTPITDPTKAVQ